MSHTKEHHEHREWFPIIMGILVLAIVGFLPITCIGEIGCNLVKKYTRAKAIPSVTATPAMYWNNIPTQIPAPYSVPEFQDQLTHIQKNWNLPLIRQKAAVEANTVLPILAAHDLPVGLYWLRVCENSTFEPGATSSAGAVGPWALTQETAERYGCPPDQRNLLVPATQAAAKFLKKLYSVYGSWPLVVAAYNWGPGNVDSLIAARNTRDYLMLPFPKETRDLLIRIPAIASITSSGGPYHYAAAQASPQSQLIWPTKGHTKTSLFGARRIGYTHQGLDIDGDMGDPIYAAANGRVVSVVYSNYGHGNHVIIDHGSYKTLYGHANRILVHEGDNVRAGQTIATVGNTGHVIGTPGTHLHFEILVNNKTVDPLPQLAAITPDLNGQLPVDYPYYPWPTTMEQPERIDPQAKKTLAAIAKLMKN